MLSVAQSLFCSKQVFQNLHPINFADKTLSFSIAEVVVREGIASLSVAAAVRECSDMLTASFP